MALGEPGRIISEVLATRSAGFSEFLLKADRPVHLFALALERKLKESIAQILAHKWKHWESIPYMLLGCWGEFAGHSIEEAQACCKQCFEELEGIGDLRQVHRLARPLLDASSQPARQLREWCNSPGSSLVDFPEAFVFVQNLALMPLTELAAEGVHRNIHMDLSDASKPPSVCAALRRHQTADLLKDERFVSWLSRKWGSHHMYRDLLECWVSAEDVCRLSEAELQARAYQFSLDDQFEDRPCVMGSVEGWSERHFLYLASDFVVATMCSCLCARRDLSGLRAPPSPPPPIHPPKGRERDGCGGGLMDEVAEVAPSVARILRDTAGQDRPVLLAECAHRGADLLHLEALV